MFNSKSRKQAVDLAELNHLIDQALAEISDLGDPTGPAAEAHQLVRLRTKIEEANRSILERLHHCSDIGPMGPATITKHDPGDDAKLLFAGTDIATLTAPVEESERAALLRQHRAGKALLEELPDRLRQVNCRLERDEYAKIKPAVSGVVAAILDEYERLCVVLEALQRFDNELNRKGLSFETRGPLFSGYDGHILGGADRWPTLRWSIDQRRKEWGLADERK